MGPVFNHYELIKLSPSSEGLSVEHVLVTPSGGACFSPASVEARSVTLYKSLPELLQHKNPCTIPEKKLNREIKRCKKCLVFSGEDITLQASCGGKDRLLRMDILDRDLFDAHANTPEQTSWTMAVMRQIDEVTGPGVWDKPMFTTGDQPTQSAVPETEVVQALREGKYDKLFGLDFLVSRVVVESEMPPPPPPSVELISATPFGPLTPVLPKYYPPIAKAARIEGVVKVQYDVDTSGQAQNVTAMSGSKMLEGAAIEAVKTWRFSEAAFRQAGLASFSFKMNCQTTVQTSVN
jgi:TonB family protein